MRADKPFPRWALRSLALFAAAVLALVWPAADQARGHFLLNVNVRLIHVEHLDDGLRVYLRLPMPYLVADKLGPVTANDLPEPAPYTTNAMEEGRLVHFLDAEALRASPLGLGRLVADGHHFTLDDDRRLLAEVEQVRAYAATGRPSFA